MKENNNDLKYLDDEDQVEVIENERSHSGVYPVGIVTILILIALAGLTCFFAYRINSNRNKKELIDTMYALESECMENADQISDEMIDELSQIKEYLTGVEESISNNESLLNEYSDETNNRYSEQSTTIKNQTSKVTNEFNKLNGEIKTTKESIEKLIKELESKENNNTDLVKQLITELKETENKNSDTVEKLISELKQTDTKEFASLTKLINEVEKDGEANKETIVKLINELETKESDRQTQIKEEFDEVQASIRSIDEKFTKSHDEIKKLIRDLSAQSGEETDRLLETLTLMDSELTELENSSLTQIDEKLTSMENKYSELLTNLENIVSQDFDDLNETINNRYDELNTTVNNKYDEVNENVNNKFESLSVSFTNNNDDVMEELGNIRQDIQLVFQLVSDGKQVIASAITDKGVDSSKDAKFMALANDIAMIGSEICNIEPGYILEGTKVYDGLTNTYVEGSMPDRGYQEDFNPSGIDQRTYESGYYPNSWTVDMTNAYNKGYADGKADVPHAHIEYVYHEHKLSDGTVKSADYTCDHADGCFCEPVYNIHHHTGSPSYGGGCYTIRHEEEVDEHCGGSATTDWGVGYGEYWYCNKCGARMDGNYGQCEQVVGHHTEVYYTLGCGKSEGGRESVAYYKLGCGKKDYATAGEDADIASATIVFED